MTIARNELERLSEAEREQFELAAARRTAMAMMVAADMLARTGALLDAPDVYDMPPHVVAAVAAVLTTSGLIKDAIALVDEPDSALEHPRTGDDDDARPKLPGG